MGHQLYFYTINWLDIIMEFVMTYEYAKNKYINYHLKYGNFFGFQYAYL